ncbi:peptidoglycan DD-metalloendopeptidase family protein [Agarivorans sp. B2Z047]|uniref:peptidoglycan DD-metalloendopeptidase family protein n=1 Tax=Agarivorans sp. B2Z047 TaxID=2652721 RepID=UPI00128CC15F|nr:peptidoglycan DD-metalloendopeptidase family protein [Agarivorans sp. B2Z047]MPW29238.1 peptidoglycan DD-metalloendopeptidase family protein [Agarivorans sp. B2Z047]UQN41790.1 peptidoglycan DD-metalloendopeptidase family protein [Agarivorans sp. B2Z047]
MFNSKTRLFGRPSRLPNKHWQLIIACGVLVGIASIWPSSKQVSTSSRQLIELPQNDFKSESDGITFSLASRSNEAIDIVKQNTQDEPSAEQFRQAAESPVVAKPNTNEPTLAAAKTEPEQAEVGGERSYQYTIEKGDTLGKIFTRFNIDQTTMYQVLEADISVLALDTLSPGHDLTFTIDHDQQQLMALQLAFNPAQKIIFKRVDASSFEYETINIEGQWQKQAIAGTIEGSFYVSARKAGLSPSEVEQVAQMFKDKLRFSRDFRAGDVFQVVRNRQYIDDELTGQSEISAVRIFNRGNEYSAYLFSNGNYYDKDGESLARAFMRVPLKGAHRVTSGFNPRRKHPITRRISPHNGADFGVAIGTPVLAAGDGVVTRVENHPYAGKYIVIQHGGKYRSRYLHLNKFKVRKGQRVTRGQVIADSGNTGRSTGPHLHYEFHINGRAVNPMTAKIPLASAIDKQERAEFDQLVSNMNDLIAAG